LESIIQSLIASTLKVSPEEIRVTPLQGDASDRKFYRVLIPNGETRVVMKLAGDLPGPKDPDQLSYLNILTHLTLCKASVPKLHHYDPDHGILILEDMGSMTLEDHVKEAGLEKSLPLYRKGLEELLILQITGTRKQCEHCMAFHHRFDVEKLMWELDFFLEHTVKGYLGRELSSSDSSTIRNCFLDLCRIIAGEPPYFTHRDYHSRNLMVKDGKIGIVDFQDARLGPLQYDLCSLLRDSYVVLPEVMVDELITFYLDNKDQMEGTKTDPLAFRRIFDLTSVQRNLKAAGTFGYMAGVKGEKRYLQYLPDTFAYVRKNLQQYPELNGLRASLGNLLPELL
jgi:aminoglycoside/choline kinase family phosphotransferase